MSVQHHPLRAFISVKFIAAVCAGLILVPFAKAHAASQATRSFSCDAYAPTHPAQVTIQVNPDPAVVVYALEEEPPSGWTPSQISHDGVYDAVNNKVKWGPYFDANPRALSYAVTPPAGQTGTVNFIGTLSTSIEELVPVGGPSTLVLDTTPPTISCPPSVAPIPAGNNCLGILPDLTGLVNASDNCDPNVMVTQDPAAGTALPLGNSTVTLIATDWAGNTSSCTVTVSVTNAPPVITEGPGPLQMTVRVNSGCQDTENQLTLHATDANNDPSALSWSVATPPALGDVTLLNATTGASVTICYTPASNQVDPATFVIRVADPCGASDDIPIDVSIGLPAHPSDLNQDWRIVIGEMTAYATCWRTGCTWSVPPNPVPIHYMTRGAYLWRIGEWYSYNPDIAPPLCWEPGLASQSLRTLRTTEPGDTLAKALASEPPHVDAERRIEPVANVPGSFRVVVTISPQADTLAWAVEESLPEGWRATDLDDEAHYDPIHHQLKWGPFLDGITRTLSYGIAPENETAGENVAITGVVSAHGWNQTIFGDTTVAELEAQGLNLPADGSPCAPGAAPLLLASPALFLALRRMPLYGRLRKVK